MNPHTGHLIAAATVLALTQGYEELPKRLQEAAKKELAGHTEARVDLRKGGPLQAWARKKRKAKIAAKSRRTNRSRK